VRAIVMGIGGIGGIGGTGGMSRRPAWPERRRTPGPALATRASSRIRAPRGSRRGDRMRHVYTRVLASGRRSSEDRAEVFERADDLVVVVADGARGARPLPFLGTAARGRGHRYSVVLSSRHPPRTHFSADTSPSPRPCDSSSSRAIAWPSGATASPWSANHRPRVRMNRTPMRRVALECERVALEGTSGLVGRDRVPRLRPPMGVANGTTR
jgi:hypothetical protein